MTQGQDESLAKVAILTDLDPADLEKLEQRCSWRKFKKQELIIDRQADSREVYFIVDGRVRVVNYSLSGREVTFDDLEAGESFGELAALDSQPRSANVVALEDTTVASLTHDAFRELLLEHPELALKILVVMAGIIRTSTERIMDLSTLGANNRVHAELLRLAKPGMREDNTAVITPIPIHGDIASRVSTTRETVARVLGDMSRNELVKREEDKLIILDVEYLSDMVEQFRGS
ncbi:MAG: Crp/Fnr family transcriptional regulator [Alphaproteobacteria bacterium]|nr:Crp/Fnr family transcriptional regulator [Alphaproteobacteria bacterium]